jgi:hypothetical protein
MTIPLLNFGSIKVLLEAIKSASAKALISLILEGNESNGKLTSSQLFF